MTNNQEVKQKFLYKGSIDNSIAFLRFLIESVGNIPIAKIEKDVLEQTAVNFLKNNKIDGIVVTREKDPLVRIIEREYSPLLSIQTNTTKYL